MVRAHHHHQVVVGNGKLPWKRKRGFGRGSCRGVGIADLKGLSECNNSISRRRKRNRE